MSLHNDIKKSAMAILMSDNFDKKPIKHLNEALRLLSKWRCALIANTIIDAHGTKVHSGPLYGLDYRSAPTEGCHAPKLIGTYEQPLHPYIEEAIQTGYQIVLNIGAADGYYAVGMALHMTRTQVIAFDIDAEAGERCRRLAEVNSVAERVQIETKRFQPADFAAWAGQDVLVFADAEGSEKALLDPAQSPALCDMDLIVEAHEGLVPGIAQTLIQRFSASHDIIQVIDDGQRRPPEFLSPLVRGAHLDILLGLWEWRIKATPWLVMYSKSRNRHGQTDTKPVKFVQL